MKYLHIFTGDDLRKYEDSDHTILCNGQYERDNHICWLKDGLYHREDGPAIIYTRVNGNKEWHIDGHLIFSKHSNNIHLYKDLSESFKRSIIKYELSK
jgi:hypothetical protein